MADSGAANAAAAAPTKNESSKSSSSNKGTSPAIPVGLREAALDSPTFRSVAVHFAEQVDGIERWLEGYVKSTTKVAHDMLALEETINSFISKNMPPLTVADGMIDPDYTLLALKRVGDGQREWWNQILTIMRRMDGLSIEPIRSFLHGDLRAFKECRKTLDQAQKTFDSTLARYVAQSKAKEPSSLREDAFTVYETRKAYLKSSMDFCQLAPQIRYTLDKLLVKISFDTWREMKRWRDASYGSNKFAEEMDRIRGWSKELEASEATFKRELQSARRDVGEDAVAAFKPSRELEDYSTSTVAFLGSRGPMSVQPKDESAVISEKQDWLFLRTITKAPARHSWVRRWYYCRNGIFGWLVQGPQGVLQGDEIGVLLCNAKPAVQEERRFCFEIKTKAQNIMLQAETQSQLMEWLQVFEVAKKQAFDASMARDNSSLPGGIDPAFAITPPLIPEFSAKGLEGLSEGDGPPDRSGTLPLPGDPTVGTRASFDVGPTNPRRVATGLGTGLGREEGESGREHAARIMQRLDLHRKTAFGNSSTESSGIAGLISASSNLLPGYMAYNASVTNLGPGSTRPQLPTLQPIGEVHSGTLAPSTLAKPPTTTLLSKVAVAVSSERGASTDAGMPTAVVANYWGSNPWSTMYSSRDDDTKHSKVDDELIAGLGLTQMSPAGGGSGDHSKSPVNTHRRTISVGAAGVPDVRVPEKPAGETFHPSYPAELKAQHPQFRLLFPNVPLEEKLVLVFNAAWNSTSKDGPFASGGQGLAGNGRIYVTPDNMYFYGQQMGLVTAYTLSLDIISEVTAAPGKDNDFVFLHLNQDQNQTGLTRITIKTFLEDLALLHARLNLLIDDLQAEEPMDPPELVNALIGLENDEYEKKSPSAESWEEVSSNTPMDDGTIHGRPVYKGGYEHRQNRLRNIRKHVPKLQLPTHAIEYEPEDMHAKVEERNFEISAKACFHVLFGDKSFIFPKLYFERRAKEIAQGPWELIDHGKMKREFKFKVDVVDIFGRSKPGDVVDSQVIDVFSDHVTYVVTHVRTPWHLPHSNAFKIIAKVVITHVAKSKCKLALYTKVEWTKTPPLSRPLIQRQALQDAARDAEELADVATDQVRKLNPNARTKRAIQVYGNIGQQTQVISFTPGDSDSAKKPHTKPRTLTNMVVETLRSFTESVATSILMWTFAAVKKFFNVVTAHRIILLVLLFSVLTNMVFTGREGSTWWSERSAAKFMGRMGVGPNVMMSKAVYLADLDEAAQGSTVSVGAPHGSEWYAILPFSFSSLTIFFLSITDIPSGSYETFREIMNTTDIDSPYEEAGAALSSSNSRSTARRILRTRQRLGSYRHDLLVAMRVVNSIEREMIQSEWENWLADENIRCEQVAMMLQEKSAAANQTASTPDAARKQGQQQNVMRPVDEQRIETLRKWHAEYCGSCSAEKTHILEARSKLVDT